MNERGILVRVTTSTNGRSLFNPDIYTGFTEERVKELYKMVHEMRDEAKMLKSFDFMITIEVFNLQLADLYEIYKGAEKTALTSSREPR